MQRFFTFTELRVSALLILVALSSACATATNSPPPPACPVCPVVEQATTPPIPLVGQPLSTERSKQLSLVAFSKDGKRLCLQSDDQLIGNSYTVYSTADLSVVKMYNYLPFNRKTVWKRAVRQQKLLPLSQGTATSTKTGATFLAADTPTHLVVYTMVGQQITPWFQVPRLKDEDGQLATISVKHLLVSPAETHVVLVHRQSFAGSSGFATDAIHTIAIDTEP